MAEHSAVNRRVVSSSLTCGANQYKGRVHFMDAAFLLLRQAVPIDWPMYHPLGAHSVQKWVALSHVPHTQRAHIRVYRLATTESLGTAEIAQVQQCQRSTIMTQSFRPLHFILYPSSFLLSLVPPW